MAFYGRRDPFNSSVGHDASPMCHSALEYAIETGFASLFAPLRPTKASSLITSWKGSAVQVPILFHAEVVASVGWVLLMIGGQSLPVEPLLYRLQMEQRQLALETLRKELENPKFEPTDAHVHAIAFLAFQSGGPMPCDEPYPSSPMGLLQHVYAFSRFEATLPHVTALYNFVRARGGIDKIQLHALADVLEVVDIVISTRTQNPCRFPLIRTKSKLAEKREESVLDSYTGTRRIGGHELLSIKKINLTIYRLLVQMSQVTGILDRFHEDSSRTELSGVLIMRRNEIQHGLLGYPTAQYSEYMFMLDEDSLDMPPAVMALTEMIRLAASIYSDLVLFPQPWITGIKLQLAQRLRMVAEKSGMYDNIKHSIPNYPKVHVWILWFGCFAAFRTEHQGWFEDKLRWFVNMHYGMAIEKAENVRFKRVKEGLRGFLWWSPVCDQAGQALWSRLTQISDEDEDEDDTDPDA
ncbi:hypothetical protein PV10_06686 [Exophiala mesophila]|uniref:Transcription factor domain-containing protein n=1 Tax=Exophiala mesophila TaxID=212818 RepID=A0A0D1ZZF6_EXOME|nr:uncharacterized protein PV10_06686 [Exophiala mesophila]KIV92228.1 hypothetical protein PV10_06686 [Exophiala mesophila]